jgi:hypothetical protein
MVAGVCLTRKSQSTNLLRDTCDQAEYVDFLGGKFPSLHLKIGVYRRSCFVQRKRVLILVFYTSDCG